MINRFLKHVRTWAEAYVWAPLSLGAVPLMALLAYFMTGRATQENLDWLVDLAGRVFTVITAIVILSLAREANGTWWGRDELKKQPILYIVSSASKLVLFGLILYVLTH